jgi:taurine dioxygenase
MSGLQLKALTIGAEVVGLAAGAEEDPAIRSALYDAWLTYGILLFHGVDSIPAHLSLSSVFGEPEMHPRERARDLEEPLLMKLTDDREAAVYDGDELRLGRISWHRDTAFTKGIAKGAMLRLRTVPPQHGETFFADTAKAYDDLPEDVKQRVEGLEYKASLEAQFRLATYPGALWQTKRFATVEEYPPNAELLAGYENAIAEKLPPVVHPVVIRHPESGRKCIFISPKEAERILGVSQAESDELLDYLVNHMIDDRYTFAHHWAVDDAIVWDNRRMLHAAAGFRVDQHRRGQRTTLKGQFDVGRNFDPATDGDCLHGVGPLALS